MGRQVASVLRLSGPRAPSTSQAPSGSMGVDVLPAGVEHRAVRGRGTTRIMAAVEPASFFAVIPHRIRGAADAGQPKARRPAFIAGRPAFPIYVASCDRWGHTRHSTSLRVGTRVDGLRSFPASVAAVAGEFSPVTPVTLGGKLCRPGSVPAPFRNRRPVRLAGCSLMKESTRPTPPANAKR